MDSTVCDSHSLKHTKPFLLLCVLFSLVITSGCDRTTREPELESMNVLAKKTKDNNSKPTPNGLELWPANIVKPSTDTTTEKRVADILSRMSLEEKVGQIIQPEIKFVTPEDIKKYHIGSVLNGGGTFPNSDKHAPVSAWIELADAYYQASMDESDGKIGIPLIWGSDAVHGHNNVFGATLFPHNIGLGAAHDEQLIQRIGEATAIQVAVTGIDWTFAPTVAVVNDTRWGRTYESYSENPDLVSRYAEYMVRGIQGNIDSSTFLDKEHLVATAKHFIGDGGTHRGVDQGDTKVSEEELVNIHAPGFLAAIEAGAQTVMASFNSWNGEKMHANRYLLSDVLKEKLGFDGFVVSDWNGHRQIPGCTVESCPNVINAGIDMCMVPSDWKAFYYNTLAQVQSGEIPLSRIDDAVSRILRVKIRAGLFESGLVSKRIYAGKNDLIAGKDHRSIAREAVRKSLVLLKNNNNLLPLSANQNILVAGNGADNITKQNGGWSLTWQGTGNTNEDFPNATSIFDGIKNAVSKQGGEVVLSNNGDWSKDMFADRKRPDAAIIVFGEEPYAEGQGDISDIEYSPHNKSDLELIEKLNSDGITTVAVFITGRPLWINKELNASDAFVVAWLPGSEGAGIADVLFSQENGEINYDFIGRLPFSWPKYAHQAVLNKHQPDYDPLFEYGYGLSYNDKISKQKAAPEEKDSPHLHEPEEAWLFVSRAIQPWQLSVQALNGAKLEMTGNKIEDDQKNLSVSSIDKLIQEDARKATWAGITQSTLSIDTQYPQDLSVFLNKGFKLAFDFIIERKPSDDVFLKMQCGNDCEASLLINDMIESAEQGWTTALVDLQCFVKDGMEFNKLTSAFALSTAGTLTLSIASVKIVSDETASASNHTNPNININCE